MRASAAALSAARLRREILGARFYLHGPDFALRREPHQIGAATIGERNFKQRRKAVILQNPRDPARE